jgi:DNA-binding transcriptional regulator YhcF (GntR family)
MELEELPDLDMDDPRPPSQKIANALRAAIRTKKLEPGDKLPSQPELAVRYSVARETVKAALAILKDERLIVSRMGSGSYVRAQTEKPVGLRPHIEEAFTQPHVSIDFAGFSGETLHGALVEPLDKVRDGRLAPESLTVRILLPDLNRPVGIPMRVATTEDDPAVRARSMRIARRHTEAIVEAVQELGDLGIVKSATAEVRLFPAAPLFKLYVLNGQDAFFGFYPMVEHTVRIDGQPVAIYDPMGKDALLFHRTATDDLPSDGVQWVEQAMKWFDSIWSTIAVEAAL